VHTHFPIVSHSRDSINHFTIVLNHFPKLLNHLGEYVSHSSRAGGGSVRDGQLDRGGLRLGRLVALDRAACGAHDRDAGWLGRLVGPFDLGDGHLVHHPRW
jgi:hypothetical protein